MEAGEFLQKLQILLNENPKNKKLQIVRSNQDIFTDDFFIIDESPMKINTNDDDRTLSCGRGNFILIS